MIKYWSTGVAGNVDSGDESTRSVATHASAGPTAPPYRVQIHRERRGGLRRDRRNPAIVRPVSSAGFTLLELLVALVILVSATTIVWATFSSTLRAWQRGTALTDDLHHGDFVMEQLTAALRSAAFFHSDPALYEFRLEKRGGGQHPADVLSWVTTSPAFMPGDSPWVHGLHRIVATVDRDRRGERGFAVTAFHHLEDRDDLDADFWFISGRVQGLRCEVYDYGRDQWVPRWPESNSIPSRLKVTLYLEPPRGERTPIQVTRVIDIPVAPVVTQALDQAEGGMME